MDGKRDSLTERVAEALVILLQQYDLLPYDLYPYIVELTGKYEHRAARIYDDMKDMLLEECDFDGWRMGDKRFGTYIYDDDRALEVIAAHVAPFYDEKNFANQFRKEIKKILYASSEGSALQFSELVRIAAIRVHRARAANSPLDRM